MTAAYALWVFEIDWGVLLKAPLPIMNGITLGVKKVGEPYTCLCSSAAIRQYMSTMYAYSKLMRKGYPKDIVQ